jgi:hypothetical protein
MPGRGRPRVTRVPSTPMAIHCPATGCRLWWPNWCPLQFEVGHSKLPGEGLRPLAAMLPEAASPEAGRARISNVQLQIATAVYCAE